MFQTRARFRLCLTVATILIFGLIHITPQVRERFFAAPVPSWSPPRNGWKTLRTAKEAFSDIYARGIWGADSTNTAFYSGTGSHYEELVDPYVTAVRSFIDDTFVTPPNAVDLGCGDFNVGRQIRNATNRYTACDVVPDLIDYNRQAYASDEVDFQVLDITSEEPPAADIVFVRQVLQHLNNHQVSLALPKLRRYEWAIITDHLPFNDSFAPNRDIPTGSVRIAVDSGLVLTEPPFDLAHYSATVLCEVQAIDGRIRTTAYRFHKPWKS